MTYLEYLPAYVIHLDRAAERRVAVERVLKPLFHSLTLIPAVDGITLSCEDVKLHATHVNDAVWLAAKERGLLVKYPGRATGDGLRTTYPPSRITPNSRALHYVASVCAIYRSHLRALEAGLTCDHPRFIILEDDATPRTSLLHIKPPIAHDVVLWGSITMGSFNSDTRIAMRSRHYWTRPTTRYSTLLATATEYSREGAKRVHEVMTRLPGQWDTMWWEALYNMRVIKSVPAVFTQGIHASTYKT